MGGALLLCPAHSRAEPYTLLYSLAPSAQGFFKGSRAPKRPLVVDLVGHTLTLPSQVIAYSLILESEDGEVYTYPIKGTIFEIPQGLSGDYRLSITDGNVIYKGTIFIK